MSTYTEYISKVESALVKAVDTYVTKQKIDADEICHVRIKTRVLSMYTDMIPLLHNCGCVSADQLKQIQNHIIKITATPSIGIIDDDDLACGGISTQIIRVTGDGTGGSSATPQQECRNVSLIKDTPFAIHFGNTIGTSGSSWVFPGKPFCYNSFGEVGFGISSRDQNGFTVTADEDSTFEFCVLAIGSGGGAAANTYYDNGVFDMEGETPTAVLYAIQMPVNDYSLTVECYDETGTMQQHRLTSVSVNGFTVETMVKTTVRWEAEAHI